MIFLLFPQVYARKLYNFAKKLNMLIGREKESKILRNALTEEQSQFIAVYGRRRVGKTFLIREAYENKFCFSYTGADKMSSRKQLSRFRRELKDQGLTEVPELTNWGDAFSELKRFINKQPDGKKVIFIDELPWMDAPRSGFLPELEVFWNGWASARKDIVFIVCGSSTSWMVKKIIKNKGGLHNRLNHKISLKPFSLGLCEQLCKSRGLLLERKQILEGYMVFGGIPYYWSLLQKGYSIRQELDRLIFSEDGELHYEFDMLYASLFKNPDPYIKIIEILSTKKRGLTRKEILQEGKFEDNGSLSGWLNDLEWCGFIRSYTMMGYTTKSEIYQLIDNYTIFYFEYLAKKKLPSGYWTSIVGTPKYNTWCGLSFERVCLLHIEQIKQKLGISGVITSEYAWRCNATEESDKGVQIDVLIDRNDGIIDVCEIKYAKERYAITKDYSEDLIRKIDAVALKVKGRKAIHLVMITTEGINNNEYSYIVQNEVKLDDLFLIN